MSGHELIKSRADQVGMAHLSGHAKRGQQRDHKLKVLTGGREKKSNHRWSTTMEVQMKQVTRMSPINGGKDRTVPVLEEAYYVYS